MCSKFIERRVHMDFGFSNELKRTIVTGVMNGYTNFLLQRKVFEEELLISSAFTWMKSNYIDSSIASSVPENVTYQIKQKASWKYIVFDISHKDETYRFIMKPPTVFNSIKGSDYYLSKSVEVNEGVANSQEFKKLFNITDQDVIDESLLVYNEIDLFDSEDFDRFYIISYEADVTKGIKSIEIYLPYGKSAYCVSVLTPLIDELGLSIPEELIDLKSDGMDVPEEPQLPNSDSYSRFNVIRSEKLE